MSAHDFAHAVMSRSAANADQGEIQPEATTRNRGIGLNPFRMAGRANRSGRCLGGKVAQTWRAAIWSCSQGGRRGTASPQSRE